MVKEHEQKGIIVVLLIICHIAQRDKNANDKKIRIKKKIKEHLIPLTGIQ